MSTVRPVFQAYVHGQACVVCLPPSHHISHHNGETLFLKPLRNFCVVLKSSIESCTLQNPNRFVVDNVAIRVYKNANYTNNFFPNTQPMYIFSSIWNADSWATDGGLVHTNWSYAPFVSSYTAFTVDACLWVDPHPACIDTTTQNWWDQYGAWHLSEDQLLDYAWVQRNLLVYDYCGDTVRYPILPEECSLDPYS